jgi:hypothetical protein
LLHVPLKQSWPHRPQLCWSDFRLKHPLLHIVAVESVHDT